MRLPIELEGCNDDPWLCKCETQLAYHSVLVRYYVCVVRSGGVFIFYFPSVLKEGNEPEDERSVHKKQVVVLEVERSTDRDRCAGREGRKEGARISDATTIYAADVVSQP